MYLAFVCRSNLGGQRVQRPACTTAYSFGSDLPLPFGEPAISMPALSAVAGGTATTASAAVGGSGAALSWPSLLAFGAIMLAAMQGTLVMESADPCRISFRKLQVLLSLEALEVVVALASEVFSFVQLRGALSLRLQWLQWVAPCLLCIGILEILLDVYFTLNLAAQSRVLWIPFSNTGKKPDAKKLAMIFEMLPLLVTAISSLCLIGWRQQWWWVAPAVVSDDAISAAKRESALSTGAIAFSSAWAFVLTVGMIYDLSAMELFADDEEDIGFPKLLGHVLRPNGWIAAGEDRKVMRRKCDNKTVNAFKHLHRLSLVEEGDVQDPDEETTALCLEQAPLHVGNAIVSLDQKRQRGENLSETEFFFDWNKMHTILLLVENMTILPLQICLVTAVARLADKLDEETFRALKEIVDAVIVLALVEIAVGLKNILWGVGGSPLHDYDIPSLDNRKAKDDAAQE